MSTDAKQPLDTARPVVNLITSGETAAARLPAICLGLEEEGIPWRQRSMNAGTDLTAMAKQAADLSRLNVGLAIGADTVVLHHRDLSRSTPLFTLSGPALTAQGLRRLGANAARLVKGNPLLFDEPSQPTESDDAPVFSAPTPKRHPADDIDPNPVAEIVARVLAALKGAG
jgi:hypothetical protein